MIDDGGPAFPGVSAYGVSKLEFFAAFALAGHIAALTHSKIDLAYQESTQEIARAAFRMARAMLDEMKCLESDSSPDLSSHPLGEGATQQKE